MGTFEPFVRGVSVVRFHPGHQSSARARNSVSISVLHTAYHFVLPHTSANKRTIYECFEINSNATALFYSAYTRVNYPGFEVGTPQSALSIKCKERQLFADFQNAVIPQPVDEFLCSTPEMKGGDAYVPFLLSKWKPELFCHMNSNKI